MCNINHKVKSVIEEVLMYIRSKGHMRSKGQITIPKEIREKLGLLPHTEVEFYTDGNELILRKKVITLKGEKLIRHLASIKCINIATEDIVALMRGE
jgi:AbrB family looped-hinge helix DNA binding protein